MPAWIYLNIYANIVFYGKGDVNGMNFHFDDRFSYIPMV